MWTLVLQPGGGLSFCISNKLPGAAGVAGQLIRGPVDRTLSTLRGVPGLWGGEREGGGACVFFLSLPLPSCLEEEARIPLWVPGLQD